MAIRVCADVVEQLYAGRVEPDGQETVLHGWLIGASQDGCILGSFACLVPAGAQTAGNLSADLGANCLSEHMPAGTCAVLLRPLACVLCCTLDRCSQACVPRASRCNLDVWLAFIIVPDCR